MSPDLPSFSDATDAASGAADAVREHARTLLPWLPDPPHCEDCGALMYADATFDPQQAIYVDCWGCRECGRQLYRDDPHVSGDPAPPRPRS